MAAKEERRLALADGVQEYLDCAQEIRATNQARAFLRDLGGKLDDFERSEVASELLTGVSISSSQAVLKLGIASVVLVGAGLMVSGQVGFLTYFGFLLVVTRVYDPVNVVLQSSSELLEMRHAIRRTNGLMRTPAMGGSPEFRPRGFDLSFEDVSFSYGEGARVLDRVSFTAREGQVTALVGPSGSGKSTCAKLAARFWDPDAGTVRLGGVDVSGIDPEALLSAYAEVFQDVVLFDETVMENIRLGRADATDGEVLAAARAANCDEFVHALPEGYQTRIGENGARLSGGERQRISIARALLKDAPVVLLDEATASLDVENESQVQRALSRLLAGKTVLVIAHRMRTVMGADKVVVLEGGTVVEQGAPDDLLRREAACSAAWWSCREPPRTGACEACARGARGARRAAPDAGARRGGMRVPWWERGAFRVPLCGGGCLMGRSACRGCPAPPPPLLLCAIMVVRTTKEVHNGRRNGDGAHVARKKGRGQPCSRAARHQCFPSGESSLRLRFGEARAAVSRNERTKEIHRRRNSARNGMG